MQSSSHSNEYPEHIAWSSSDTEQSEDENQEKKNSKAVSQQQQRRPQRSGKATAPIQSYIRALSMLTADKGEKRKSVLTHWSEGNLSRYCYSELFLKLHLFYFTF